MAANKYDTLRNVTLGEKEVHVWRYGLDRPASEIMANQSLLCPTEKQRMQRLRITTVRNRFIAARGILRRVLAAYLNLDPAGIQFEYNEFGKPRLASRPHGEDIQFNLTHSHDTALLAVTSFSNVGIDTEYPRTKVDHEAIAKRFFSPSENAALLKLRADQRERAFFHCWTCKEAYIKARGDGLRYPLRNFDVSVDPDKPAELLATRPDSDDVLRWTLMKLEAPSPYAAALVVQGQDIVVLYRTLP